MNIEFGYPVWYSLICILVGVAYSFFFYRKEKLFDDIRNVVVYSMAFLRFITVTLLCLLLMEPLIQTETEIVENPVLILASDNSESLLLNKDSSFYKNELKRSLSELEKKISEKYEVKTYSFGDHVAQEITGSYKDKQTDVSEFIDDIHARFYGQNIGAVILATDGIVNKGSNPLYDVKKIKHTPFYTIALGDTSIRRDVSIQEIKNNRIAYKGNKFPVEVVLKGKKISGEKIKLSILKKNEVVFTKELTWEKGKDVENISALLEAKDSGKQKYIVKVSELDDELTYENNIREFYIDVLDNRQKILLLARAPHPDLGAFRLAWDQNTNYEVEVKLVDDFSGNFDQYSMVLLHDLPVDNKHDNLIEKLIAKKIPLFFVLGNKTNINKVNEYNLGITLQNPVGTTDVTPSLNSSFTRFSVNENLQQLIPSQ